ncbi:YkuS family protein [Metabacillus indicus]|uniref:YkuS family protein n=1 Tax=Metabacillus indicus TaxID=246786 RepID=UPI003CF6FF0F
MPKIGVEQSLSDVTAALQSKGYDVVELRNEEDAKGCDCCIITGQDSNIMGISNAVTSGSVFTASGYTADEICQQVASRLQ